MSQSLGLLLLRVGFGLHLAVLHGWTKIADYSNLANTFPDPIGLGHSVSLILAIMGEFVCTIAVAAGLFTRVTAIPVVCTMAVAAFVQHSGDDWVTREMALLYLIPYVTLMFTGAGDMSIDHMLEKKKLEGAKKA